MNFKLKEFEQFAGVWPAFKNPAKFWPKNLQNLQKNTKNFKYQNIKWKYVQRTMMKKKLDC